MQPALKKHAVVDIFLDSLAVIHYTLSSLADTSCFADQVSMGGKTLLRGEELRHGHAGPRRSG